MNDHDHSPVFHEHPANDHADLGKFEEKTVRFKTETPVSGEERLIAYS